MRYYGATHQLIDFVKLSSDVLYLKGEKEKKYPTIIIFPSKEGERRKGKEGRINKQKRQLSTDITGRWNQTYINRHKDI